MLDNMESFDLAATQLVRGFMDAPPPRPDRDDPSDGEEEDQWRWSPAGRTPLAAEIWKIGAPYEDYCFVFDTETTTDERQALRFGLFAVYGIPDEERVALFKRGKLNRFELDKLAERGIFYDPAEVTAAELVILQDYAGRHHMKVYTRAEFVNQVFYSWVYHKRALCIGHNLPFDLSRLATEWIAGVGRFRGGFSLALCDCAHGVRCFRHPAIRIKTLGPKKASFAFRRTAPTLSTAKKYPGKFLDTTTLGLALLGPGDPSLAAMGERFRADVRKAPPAAHGQQLTAEYLDYAWQDVEATWALYRKERELYSQHAVSRPMWGIYSEASLGKAYLQDMGVPRFMQQHADFPKPVLGHFMQTYYGGRAEVRIRLQPVEIVYADFKSQYPTVNALMGLQDLLLAERIEIRHCADDVGTFLAGLTLDELQRPETWERLRCIVQVIPEGDILPVRAEYDEGSLTANIGVNKVTSFVPTWYTLADVIASVLLTGKVPRLVDAIELVPHGKVRTEPFKLFGRNEYAIDLATDDLFTRVIELRTDVKSEMKQHTKGSDRYRYLDALQLALKLLANSTAYGVLVEVNERSDRDKPPRVSLHSGQSHSLRTSVIEDPGPYFAGPVGTLIPAAGRLLLAIAERLAADQGVGYAFCDTDSIAFARPADMPREQFRQISEDVARWFEQLCPYRQGGALLEIEDVNRWNGAPEALMFIGVSAKRYAVYNRLKDRTYRIRKFSSHATGDIINPPEGLHGTPDPCVKSVFELGGARWKYDCWYRAIEQLERGKSPAADRITVAAPALDVPVLTKITISTAGLWNTFQRVPGIRPFSFITVLPALNEVEIADRETSDKVAAIDAGHRPGVSRYTDLAGVTYYAPFGTSIDAIMGKIRRSDTHELIDVEHKTLNERLDRYFRHAEAKSWPPDGIGVLGRRSVFIIEHQVIGKESNLVRDDTAEESGGIVPSEAPHAYVTEGIGATVAGLTVGKLAAATGVPRTTLYDVAKKDAVSPATRTMLISGIRRLAGHADR